MGCASQSRPTPLRRRVTSSFAAVAAAALAVSYISLLGASALCNPCRRSLRADSTGIGRRAQGQAPHKLQLREENRRKREETLDKLKIQGPAVQTQKDEETEETVVAAALPVLTRDALRRKPAAKNGQKRASKQRTNRAFVDKVTSLVSKELGDIGLKVEAIPDPTQEMVVRPTEGGEVGLRQVAQSFRRLVKQFSSGNIKEEWQTDKDVEELFRTADELLCSPIEMELDPEVIASLLHSFGRLRGPAVQKLLPALRAPLEEVVWDMNVQNLTISLGAVGKLCRETREAEPLAPSLVGAIIEKADELSLQQVVATIWAAGESRLIEEEVVEVERVLLKSLMPEDLKSMRLKDLAILCWGLAQLETRDMALVRLVAEETAARAKDAGGKEAVKDLPMLVVALARIGLMEKVMFAALDAVAERLQQKHMMKKLDDWALCGLTWAWPEDRSLPGVRDFRNTLEPQVQRRGISDALVSRSWRGPVDWLKK